MGKSLIQQRAGRGGINYRSPSWKRIAEVKYLRFTEKITGEVQDILHNPGIIAPLAKIRSPKGTFFNIAVLGLRVGQVIEIGPNSQALPGNIVRLGDLPEGTPVSNIEIKKGDGGRLARAAGAYATILGKAEGKVILKLSSGKVKEVPEDVFATVGQVAGAGVIEKPLLKAGASYHKFKLKATKWPRVSGLKMNVVDHPHGGGHHKSVGRSSTVSRNAPPGRKVGHIAARRTGRRE